MTIGMRVGTLVGKDGEFELDDAIDLASPFLRNVLLDEWPAPEFEGVIPRGRHTHGNDEPRSN